MNTTQSPLVATHTPTPWHVGQYDGELAIYDAEQYKLASLPLWRGEAAREAEANAAFIVRACNSHAQLVPALESTVKELALAFARAECDLRMWPVKDLGSVEYQSLATAAGKYFDALKQSRAALAAAKGE